MITRPTNKTRLRIQKYDGKTVATRADYLATEEPMEIRLEAANGDMQTVAVTMRTPGSDFELAAGFLFAEGVINSRDDIRQIAYCVADDVDIEQRYNIVTVGLAHQRSLPDLKGLERHFYTTSACGVCGKATLEAIEMRGHPIIPGGQQVGAEVITSLPGKLREAQGVFDQTGGLHAAALFTLSGELVELREDIGRHNALDKLIGWAMLNDHLPLHEHIVLVSGRASYELLQKSVVAGVSVFCAISAPSSLAVDVARQFGVALVGFLRGECFNVYCHGERVSL